MKMKSSKTGIEKLKADLKKPVSKSVKKALQRKVESIEEGKNIQKQ